MTPDKIKSNRLEIAFLRQALLARTIRRQLGCAVDAKERELDRSNRNLLQLLQEQEWEQD